jgi:uncharacterized membrane protein
VGILTPTILIGAKMIKYGIFPTVFFLSVILFSFIGLVGLFTFLSILSKKFKTLTI